MNVLMSNLRNNCEGYGLLNRPPISLYLHNCWWCNELLIILKEAKPKKENISNKAEVSPPPAQSNIPPQPQRSAGEVIE